MSEIKTIEEEVKELKAIVYALKEREKELESFLIKHFFIEETKSKFETGIDYGGLLILEKKPKHSSIYVTSFLKHEDTLVAPNCYYEYTVFDVKNKNKFIAKEEDLVELMIQIQASIS